MPSRLTPINELVNVAEMEAMARTKLDPGAFSEIAGGDRAAFDRITFRPRAMVDSTNLNLSVDLFGQRLFAPILAGPASRQTRFHAEGELAMARGAAAAKAAMVIAEDASVPMERLLNEVRTPFWYQATAHGDPGAARERALRAAAAGCKAVCLTVSAEWDWMAIDAFRKGLSAPLLLKGIMNPAEAKAAVGRGFQGFVISNYRARGGHGMPATVDAIAPVRDAVGASIPVLVDGAFRRGTDILKALALGASAVLVCRPVLWGLAAYGAAGVQYVLEMLQTELARSMVMLGAPDLKQIERGMVRLHRRA